MFWTRLWLAKLSWARLDMEVGIHKAWAKGGGCCCWFIRHPDDEQSASARCKRGDREKALTACEGER